MGVLAFGPDSDEEALPVFSFEEEAETFLRLGVLETGWRARKTTASELASLLYVPCTGVNKVTLEPLSVANGEMVLNLLRWSREDFLRSCVEKPSTPNRESDLFKSLNGR